MRALTKTLLVFAVSTLSLSFSVSAQSKWEKEAARLSVKAPIAKKISLNELVKPGNSKMRLSENVINEIFQSVTSCDFLVQINTLGPGTSMKSFAFCKFTYNQKGGTAYIIESRFADDVSNKSEIVRYYLITISETGEWIDQALLTQGGTYFFVNSDLGSCTTSDEANAMCNQMKGSFTINKDMSISTSRSTMYSDLKVDKKNNILKTVTAGNWSEEEKTTYSVNTEGTIDSE